MCKVNITQRSYSTLLVRDNIKEHERECTVLYEYGDNYSTLAKRTMNKHGR
jgi:hypothetical protein